MNENNDEPKKLVLKGDKKLLENPFLGSLVVPIAIVLVGALIIFGVTKMLSTETSYKDHVHELQSKAFGNKWIAAFELSKKIASSQIPEEDIPWLVESLTDVYKNSPDPRTRDFVVVALGALKHEKVVPSLTMALEDESPDVKFHALVALGNLADSSTVDWEKLKPFFSSDDHALRQAVVLTAGTHKVESLESLVVASLKDESVAVRYSAATALIYYKNEAALTVLQDLLFNSDRKGFDVNQVGNLKLNVLSAIEKVKWSRLNSVVQDVVTRDNNPKVTTKAQQVLNSLKN
ncbi:HEAT repeat domain-containing protein [Halobacteriovorax sp. HLS]|uniref:HEAT repeat domain-containing protein n=1 Tax=Halobacteriovorax sp. HLS TaxID=2234000 RepID=UPI000FDA9264|nr:HEAT repeat domain-containing protein [Halobacteriovorax sp. HLS]